jgi:hypothetical protein
MLLPLLLAFGLDAGARASDSQSPGTTVVEEVRQVRTVDGLVEKHVLIDASATDDPAALADEVTGIAQQPGGVTAQFATNPWKWDAGTLPVWVHYNPALEAPLPSLAGPLANAVQQWSSVSPTTFAFALGADTTATTGTCDLDGRRPDPHPDGLNTVRYVTSLKTGVLGQTCSYQPDDNPTIDTEFDMEMNWTVNWNGDASVGPGQYDIYSTILHEMGHAAGLAHSSDKASVMYFSLASATMKRQLTEDDVNGLEAQYPLDGPVIPRPAGIPEFQRTFVTHAMILSRDP